MDRTPEPDVKVIEEVMKGTCSICSNSQSSEVYPGLLKCHTCGYIWANLSFSYEEAKNIYGKSYFFGDEYIDYLSESEILSFAFRIFEKKLAKLFKSGAEKPKLLEIGSAYGLFLDIARKDFDVTGLEISDEPVTYSRNKGLTVLQEDLLTLDMEEQYDIIVSFATLEHLLSPEKIIRQVHRLLKPNGYCYMTTIDIESPFAKFQGQKWRMIHPPTHVSYFSSRTLSTLMKQTGFTILECKPVWQYRSLDAALLPRFENTLFYKSIHKLGLTKVPIPFNFGDIIGILVQK